MSKNLREFAGGAEVAIATNSKAGIVKGGGQGLSIAADGTISLTTKHKLQTIDNQPCLQWVSKTQVKVPAGTQIMVGTTLVNVSVDKTATANSSYFDSSTVLSAGTSYYVYLTTDGALVISTNSSYPTGYTAANTRKIGGFHTLCANAGTLTLPYFGGTHPLSGYTATNILPKSVWAANFRPKCEDPSGMVYSEPDDLWVDIYNCSGDIAAPATQYGGTRLHTKTEYAFRSGLANIGKRELRDLEFWHAALGSNEKTAVYGSKQPNPDTTGGHLDTASRRMISSIGCEEMNGIQWQWLDEIGPTGGSSFLAIVAFDGGSSTFGSSFGQLYCLRGGGYWDDSTHCGSFSRHAAAVRSDANVASGSRGCSPCTRTILADS